ncbi:MAG TPA: GNAT family N-acetyltransferase [Dehalococcoidia bacterium]|jgi:GNAT superfamily N-acetyltransferase|nr:GNAT family N-acetyltransferase [Dehalococcoidia bacterium]
MLSQRPVSLKTDKDFVLDLHCLQAFDAMPAWARNGSYRQFREGWLKTSAPQEFMDELEDSLRDKRTIAEVWHEDNRPVGFLWVTFSARSDLTPTVAELRILAVATEHQRRGIGGLMLLRAEQESLRHGAVSLRSEGSTDNEASRAMHGKQGYKVISYQYEKVLTEAS